MNRLLTPVPRGPEWEEWRCTKCGAPLCAVIPAPGMAIESLCRKCGQKEVRRIELFDIAQAKLDEMAEKLMREVRVLLDGRDEQDDPAEIKERSA